ncbi:MAG: hypothetical protein ACYTDU_17480, partial [Planctomycetota bacterium]
LEEAARQGERREHRPLGIDPAVAGEVHYASALPLADRRLRAWDRRVLAQAQRDLLAAQVEGTAAVPRRLDGSRCGQPV